MKKMLFLIVGVMILGLTGSVSARETLPLQPVSPDWVRVKAEAAEVRQMTGTVKVIDLVEGTLELKNRRTEKSFSISGDTQFKQGRNRLELKDLKPGTRVIVKYKDLGEINEARIISLKNK